MKGFKNLHVDGDTKFGEMCVNSSFELNAKLSEMASRLQNYNKSPILHKEENAMSTPVRPNTNIDYSGYQCKLLSNLKSKSSQSYQNSRPKFETRAHVNDLAVTVDSASNSESTMFSNTISFVDKSRSIAVENSLEYLSNELSCKEEFKNSTSNTEYEAVPSKEYECGICNHSFNSKNNLEKHNLTSHFVSIDVECHLCLSIFRNDKLLANHMRSCKDSSNSTVSGCICPKCGLLFKSRSSLNRHEKRFHLEIDNKIMCDVCGNVFKFKNHLTYHKRFMHPADEDRVTCDICGKEFICQLRLKKHMRSTHCSIRKYVCIICQKSFKDKKTLDVHFTVHSADKAFKCEVCQSAFRTKYKLKIHMSSHKNDQLKCRNCSKVFVVAKNYEHHVENCQKNQSQRFNCDICDKEINNRSQFELHMKFHVNPNMEIYMCDICGKSFESKVKCEKHKFYHGVDNKSLQCSMCCKSFKNNKILKNHMFLHTSDIFLYKCETCGKPFKHSGAFHSHQRVHQNEGHFECNICSDKFKWKQTYDKHMLKCYKPLQNEPSTTTSEPKIDYNKSGENVWT